MIPYFFAILIAVLGLPLGIMLNFFAKEEVKSGTKYFNKLEFLCLTLIILVAVYSFSIPKGSYFWLFIAGLIFGFIFRKPYFFLGMVMFSSFYKQTTIFLLASLMLIYGLPYGTLLKEKKGWIKQALFNCALFFIPALTLFSLDTNLFLSFGIGGLVGQLVLIFRR